MMDHADSKRGEELRRLTAGMLNSLTPQERDRRLQVFLAQARGQERNAELLRTTTNVLIRARKALEPDGGHTLPDDPLDNLLSATVAALESAGIDYAVTGSMISGIYGEPVTSQDVDIVILLDADGAKRLAQELPRRLYCPEASLLRISREGGMTNLIDAELGIKVDLSCMKPGPFRDAIFHRKARMSLGAGTTEFSAVSPEDVIMMKLEWRRDSKSQKQWANALSVARVRGAGLDWKYLFEQARALDLEEDLIQLRDEAGV